MKFTKKFSPVHGNELSWRMSDVRYSCCVAANSKQQICCCDAARFNSLSTVPPAVTFKISLFPHTVY